MKYDRVLCRLARELSHPDRYVETELGNLLADILKKETGVDIVLLGSGSVRKPSVTTLFQLREFYELFPYDDKVRQLTVTGAQLKQMVLYIFREEMFEGEHTEFYQYSAGVRIVFDRAARSLVSLELGGEPVEDEQLYTIGLQEYHYMNFSEFFALTLDDVVANARPRVIATSIHDVMIEHFSAAAILDAQVEGRIEVLNR
jgi:5'-nucleotidase